MLDNLRKYDILLGSKSPRRRELLSQLRIPFNIIGLGNVDETYPDDMPRHEVPEFLARKKAQAYSRALHDNELIITADTVVILDNVIYGKPHDAVDAKRMLRRLSGRTHQVVTGVAVTTADRTESFSCTTDVEFADIPDEAIDYYVDTFHPLDKAGAYGIQEWIGCVAVKGLNGSYYNVMGLPVHRLFELLRTF